ncbi:MAG TPA: hypothetical protein VIV60_34515, partial [Polyangiaceae bacterium]
MSDRSELLDLEALERRASLDLDWELLLDRLGGLATSEPGARRLRDRVLEPTWHAARDSMLRTAECVSLGDDGKALPCTSVPDLGDLVDRLEKGSTATGSELRDLGRMLVIAKELRVFLGSQRDSRPHLVEWLTIDQVIDRLGERLLRSIDEEGAIKDEASAQLARARAKVKQARQDLVQQLKRLMQTHADLLRDQYFSERDGRYVIPIRADAHRAIDGTVLDTSASGNTLFIEPRELTHASNTLRICISEV